MTGDLNALRNTDFDWVRSLDSIWEDADAGEGGPNAALIDDIVAQLKRDKRGRVLIGQAGIGKTHLMGMLRHRVWQSGGWFVLLDVLGLTDFWRSAALGFLTSLMQEMPDGRRQLDAVIAGVARHLGAEREVEIAFGDPKIDVPQVARALVNSLVKIESKALQHQDVFRALCLLRAGDVDAVGLAHAWLQGYDADEQARAALGFRMPPPAPIEIVRGVSWIMGLVGPTVVGLDQIDGVVNPTSLSVQGFDDLGATTQGLSEVLAAGLLQLYDVHARGKTVITCLDDSWKMLEARGLKSSMHRFAEPDYMAGMNDPASVEALIVGRLAPAYREAGFSPPFASWPFSPAAIRGAAATGMMPRIILMRCDAFRRQCLEKKRVEICDSLTGEVATQRPPSPPIDTFAADLARLRGAADIDGMIAAGDDSALGQLLVDAFDLYVRQLDPDEDVDVESKADPAKKIPPLHGRLTFTYHRENDRERHVCFRALEHTNAVAFQSRLRAALTASGISSRIPDRHLLMVRRRPLPSGAKTKQLCDAFEKAGGLFIAPADDDLRIFLALRTMREQAGEKGDAFATWLKTAKPLLATQFFKQAGLSPLPGEMPPPPAEAAVPAPAPSPPPLPAPAKRAAVDAIPVGRRMTVQEEPVTLPTRLLPRHTAIIAGSGSGKTVLLRRIVEEAALAGIPANVIDPNNDLSRLGDAWPARPEAFTADDEAKAKSYFDSVEVVVWTPGTHDGNPLFLSVLPDFSNLGDDRDERQQAIEMATETLAPLAGAGKPLQRGVLIQALGHFAGPFAGKGGGGDLRDFIALLSDLPDGLSDIGNAARLAAGMADQLRAAIATNPLLKAEGPILDPRVLVFGAAPARVRVSVINLSGLASDSAREDFVNRLQMTLFGWIKKNPSPTGLLYVIDEAQTFLPSGKPALSLGSGIKLVAQARKYGLGMIVATQAPRGIYNQIVSNCTTQFFGKQSAPTTIGAAQEMIKASGGAADDIGKLKAGEFYFATEGSGTPAKLRTPICLSFHPPNPPTPEEVVERAVRTRSRL